MMSSSNLRLREENEFLKEDNKRLRSLLKMCHKNWLELVGHAAWKSRETWKEIKKEFNDDDES